MRRKASKLRTRVCKDLRSQVSGKAPYGDASTCRPVRQGWREAVKAGWKPFMLAKAVPQGMPEANKPQ